MDDLFNEITPEELEKTEKRMCLASRIYDGMKAKGWRSKDFASAMGKNASEISKWLSGTHKFNIDTLFDIEIDDKSFCGEYYELLIKIKLSNLLIY